MNEFAPLPTTSPDPDEGSSTGSRPWRLPLLHVELPWRYAAGQVILTALGVALALSGSAWWAGRQGRIRERSELRNMLDAARVSERRLRQAVFEDSLSLAIATRIGDSIATVPDDSLRALVSHAIWWSDARPMVTPFAAPIQNGDIHLVEDQRLRALIGPYVDEIQSRIRTVDALTEARMAFLARTPLLMGNAHDALGVRASALRSQPALRDVMATLRFLDRNTVAQFRIMRQVTLELRRELERVLGERPLPPSTPRIVRDSFF